LQSFGIEPFEIGITNTVAPLPAPPVFELRTSAVEIVGVESENVPLPAYRLKFRNITTKAISALKFNVIDGASALFQGEDGRALMEPGEVHEEYIPIARAIGQGSTSVMGSAPVNTLVISSTVFADGTFDGDVQVACLFESVSIGRVAWLKRVLPLLERQIAQTEYDEGSGATQFKEKVSDLMFAATEEQRRKPSSISSACKAPSSFLEVTAESQKLALLRELDQIISTRPAPPINFKSWLRSTRDRYASWLSRLETTPLK
jgi:hypothetical protein